MKNLSIRFRIVPRLLFRWTITVAVGAAPMVSDAAETDAPKPPATQTSDDSGGSRMPATKGVKHAIGVRDFEIKEGKRERATLGKDFREMLESALFATNRFVIVDRGNLGPLTNEQKMQKKKKTAKASEVAQSGLLRPARYIASGTVTEVSRNSSKTSGSLSIGPFEGGGSSKKMSVVVVVNLTDTTTGEVVASERIRGEAGKSGFGLGLSGNNIGGHLGTFAKTPLGEAVQDCINLAVKFIAAKMENHQVEGSVVTVEGGEVIIGLGSEAGVVPGHRFTVRKLGKLLTDPGTGAVLERQEGALTGRIEVTRVQPKSSYCKIIQGSIPTRGDRAVLENQPTQNAPTPSP